MINTRIEVIRHLIKARGYERYLEIGCQQNVCFRAIDARVKVGVDPVSGGTHRMTSDKFFASNDKPFDIIFIDGDHRHPQVLRDIQNALGALAPGGAIVMHDCLPPDLRHESPDLCGTAWRAFAKYREDPNLDAITCDFDYGAGIIRVAENPLPIELPCSVDDLTYEMFMANRSNWMRPRDSSGVESFIGAWPSV